MAGAIFGEVQVSLFLAGAVFGEVQVSLFVAGAALREIWNDSWSAKCCIFQLLVACAKSNLCCEAGCGVTVLCSDHSPIMLGSVPHGKNDVSVVLEKFLGNVRESFFVAGAVFGEVGQ